MDGGLSPKSVALIHNVLSGAYRYAMQMEMIQRNPVSLVSPPPLRKTETVAAPIEAVQGVLKLAESEDHSRFTCIHLLAYTGLRLGEAIALKWDAVDLEDGHLLVLTSVRRLKAGYVVSPPKTTSGERTVDLEAKTVEVLRRHRERQDGLKDELGPIYQDDGKVFCNGFGGWLDQARITLAVKKLGERVGHPGITSRSLRHSHASVALQQGTNIVVVSKRLGHANVSITSSIYAHSLPGWQKQAAEDFAAAMNRARHRPVVETD